MLPIGNPEYVFHQRFDAIGRRLMLQFTDGLTETRYFWQDGQQVICEEVSGLTEPYRYVWGNGIDEALLRFGNGDIWYLDNQLGSVMALADDTGQVAEHYSYDVYGAVTVYDATGQQIPVTNYDNRYLFTGREYNWHTGLYHYRARTYHPLLGRFTSRDMALLAYDYALSRPTRLTDPSGLECCPKRITIRVGGMATEKWRSILSGENARQRRWLVKQWKQFTGAAVPASWPVLGPLVAPLTIMRVGIRANEPLWFFGTAFEVEVEVAGNWRECTITQYIKQRVAQRGWERTIGRGGRETERLVTYYAVRDSRGSRVLPNKAAWFKAVAEQARQKLEQTKQMDVDMSMGTLKQRVGTVGWVKSPAANLVKWLDFPGIYFSKRSFLTPQLRWRPQVWLSATTEIVVEVRGSAKQPRTLSAGFWAAYNLSTDAKGTVSSYKCVIAIRQGSAEYLPPGSNLIEVK